MLKISPSRNRSKTDKKVCDTERPPRGAANDEGVSLPLNISSKKPIIKLMQAPTDKAGLDATLETGKKGVVQQITTAIEQSATQIQK